MAKKVVAIVGSYRKDGTTEAAVDAILEGSREGGVQTTKIRLIEKRVEFCTNCRSCTQIPGRERGWCIQKDDLESIVGEIDRSDGVVLASPVNFYDVTAVFRRFMERLIGYSYWPWGLWIPMLRVRSPPGGRCWCRRAGCRDSCCRWRRERRARCAVPRR